MSHDRDYNELIHTPRWRRLRAAKLTHNPLCERCQQQGYVTIATEVHHIVPVETGIAYRDKARLMFNPDNLQALCSRCHHEIHSAINGHSKEGVARRTQERLTAFRDKFL